VLAARALGDGRRVQDVIGVAIGVALLIAAGGLVVRAYLAMVDRASRRTERRTAVPGSPAAAGPGTVTVRPIPTLVVGVVGGLVVGMTSVGSGSLIIVALLALYPSLKANQLVGTDLMQAVPLVWSAALGHILFGDFKLEITVALLAGSIPGVYLGSLISSRAPGGLIRRALGFVLLASALKMFHVDTTAMVLILVIVAAGATVAWMLLRKRHGLRALAMLEPEPEPGSEPEPAAGAAEPAAGTAGDRREHSGSTIAR
jgi:hypothetical protein